MNGRKASAIKLAGLERWARGNGLPSRKHRREKNKSWKEEQALLREGKEKTGRPDFTRFKEEKKKNAAWNARQKKGNHATHTPR